MAAGGRVGLLPAFPELSECLKVPPSMVLVSQSTADRGGPTCEVGWCRTERATAGGRLSLSPAFSVIIYYPWLLELFTSSFHKVSNQRSYIRISIIFHDGDLPKMTIFL